LPALTAAASGALFYLKTGHLSPTTLDRSDTMKAALLSLVRVSAACYAGTLLEKAGVDYVILEARKEPAVAYLVRR
jgi:hypothetical protein